MSTHTQPNVIYILTDQWRAKATGYNGDPNAITPHIDKLSSESINFANAIGTSPVCTPARAAFLTGRFPTTTGVFMNDVSLSPDENSIGKTFKKSGYDTAYIGKWHVDGHGRASYIPPERRQGFDYWKVLECTHDYQNSQYYDNNDPNIKTWPGYDAFAQTKDAQTYIQEHAQKENPFFLVLSLGPPHFPHHNAPEKYQQMVAPEKVTFPPNTTFNTPEEEAYTRKEAAGYYAHIAALDTCVRDLVATIKDQDIEENTILIFVSDHGETMGAHQKPPFTKQIFWDESCHVPFLLRYPPLTANKTNPKIMTPMGTVDIMPTLLSLCGLDIPNTVEGTDLSACVRDQAEMEDHVALYMSISPFSNRNYLDPAYRAIRTHRYTFVKTDGNDVYLFDDIEDPYQLNNLAHTPEATDIQNQLAQKLSAQLNKINDPFRESSYYLQKWGYEVDQYGAVPYAK